MNIDNKDVIEWIIPEGSVVNVTDPDGQSVWRTMEPFWVINDGNRGGIQIDMINNCTLYYSENDINNRDWSVNGWHEHQAGDTIPLDNGQGVYLNVVGGNRGDSVFELLEGFQLISDDNQRYTIGGNILSLINGYEMKKVEEEENEFIIDFTNYVPDWDNLTGVFNKIFSFNECIVDASRLVLPIIFVDESCNGMFLDCTNLSAGPILPATVLTKNCYRDMFNGCENLKTLTVYARNISAPGCLDDWLPETGGTLYIPRDTSTAYRPYLYNWDYVEM